MESPLPPPSGRRYSPPAGGGGTEECGAGEGIQTHDLLIQIRSKGFGREGSSTILPCGAYLLGVHRLALCGGRLQRRANQMRTRLLERRHWVGGHKRKSSFGTAAVECRYGALDKQSLVLDRLSRRVSGDDASGDGEPMGKPAESCHQRHPNEGSSEQEHRYGHNCFWLGMPPRAMPLPRREEPTRPRRGRDLQG